MMDEFDFDWLEKPYNELTDAQLKAVADFCQDWGDRRSHRACVYMMSLRTELGSLRAKLAECERERDHLAERYNSVVVQVNEHCKDCCCARSWDALGISTYTGKSIPEHIALLKARADRLEAAIRDGLTDGVFERGSTYDKLRAALMEGE